MTKGTQESASAPAGQKSATRVTPPPGVAAEMAAAAQQPRVVSRPEDVADFWPAGPRPALPSRKAVSWGLRRPWPHPCGG